MMQVAKLKHHVGISVCKSVAFRSTHGSEPVRVEPQRSLTVSEDTASIVREQPTNKLV